MFNFLHIKKKRISFEFFCVCVYEIIGLNENKNREQQKLKTVLVYWKKQRFIK